MRCSGGHSQEPQDGGYEGAEEKQKCQKQRSLEETVEGDRLLLQASERGVKDGPGSSPIRDFGAVGRLDLRVPWQAPLAFSKQKGRYESHWARERYKRLTKSDYPCQPLFREKRCDWEKCRSDTAIRSSNKPQKWLFRAGVPVLVAVWG
ncbi:hypothetical protein AV530_001835 [Patagioenas fasciata monilis]|uniref:Uncharacterized protein n=1 Tax=Patagioenas fasciata monilis TaxID=372326 RepID=A0A1V4JSI7_PATFA|nr:hypothetical protein AV530_001835 [Patagioenas fasciata monilis]